MANITTRANKGVPLSFQEVDDNFTGLNQDVASLEASKYDASDRANESQARAGLDNTTLMTPLRVSQAIDSQGSRVSLGLVVALG